MLAKADIGRYLVDRGVLTSARDVVVDVLSGGVSCSVFAVQSPSGALVVKQALRRLRVAQVWEADPARARHEAAALAVFNPLTPDATPVLLDADADLCTITMTRASQDWLPWKIQLLAGDIRPEVGAWLGTVLGTWHESTRYPEHLDPRFQDLSGFHELRLSPYHRAVQARHPEHSSSIDEVIDSMLRRRLCLVHGDFSPKNVLVGETGGWVLDFEVAHFGDPTFDLAFLLTHLLCKSAHQPKHAMALRACAAAFLTAYEARVSPDLTPDPTHLARQLGCLLLARVDGKSPVEYLSPAQVPVVRSLGLQLLLSPDPALADAFVTAAGGRP